MNELRKAIDSAMSQPKDAMEFFKGDTPGHEFRGNQYSGGGGNEPASPGEFSEKNWDKLQEKHGNAEASANKLSAAANKTGEAAGLLRPEPRKL